MNTSDMEPKAMPRPKSCMNKPDSMGFRTNLYGPVVTSFGEGKNGAGVPFTLMKYETERNIKNIPRMMRKMPNIRFHG